MIYCNWIYYCYLPQYLLVVQRLQHESGRFHDSDESLDKDDLRHDETESPDAGTRKRRVSGLPVLSLESRPATLYVTARLAYCPRQNESHSWNRHQSHGDG